MDRNTFLAITLCFLIFLGWQKYYIEPQVQQQRVAAQKLAEQNATTGAVGGAPSSVQSPSGATPGADGKQLTQSEAPQIPPQTKTLSTKTGDISISNGPRLISNWTLRDYRQGMTKETSSVDIDFVINQSGALELAFDDPSFAYITQTRGTLKEISGGLEWSHEDAKVKITKTIITTPETPYIDVRTDVAFKAEVPKFAYVSLSARSPAGPNGDPEEADRQLVYFTNNSIERLQLKDFSQPGLPIHTPVKYIGAASRYFLLSALPQGTPDVKALVQSVGTSGGKISLAYPIQGNAVSLPVRVFFGPKDLGLLRSVDPVLDHTVDFGWYTVIAYPLLRLLKWFYSFVLNYGVAIILLTIFVRLLTYPLTYKSMKSMKEMSRIQPQLQRLRDQYKDDKEALNREMLNLMRTHGYNPAAGCLPILVQLPVFVALYNVLGKSVELYHAPFMGWIHDLSSKDPLFVTPILLTVTMYLQQKLAPNTATDPMQQKMLQFMPIIFGVMMVTLPAGLTLYMLVSTIAGIIQQLILNKKLGLTPASTPARVG